MANRLGYIVVLSVFLRLFLFSINLSAQEGKLTFVNGIITYSSTGKVIPNVHVVNAQSRYGITTDTLGVFRIPASETDTLRVSSIGYETAYVPAHLFSSDENLFTFGLQPKTYMLQEANVMALQWQAFKQEILSMEIPEEQWESKRWIEKNASEEQLEAIKLSATGFGINYISKEDRQRMKVKELKRKDRQWTRAKHRVSKKVVAHLTKLKGAELDKFYKTLYFDPERILAMNDYQLTLHINKLYENYLIAQNDSVHD